jgi:hypothetical protein
LRGRGLAHHGGGGLVLCAGASRDAGESDGGAKSRVRAGSPRATSEASEGHSLRHLGEDAGRDFKRAQTRLVIVDLRGGDDFVSVGFAKEFFQAAANDVG